jgi:hypothetical protein
MKYEFLKLEMPEITETSNILKTRESNSYVTSDLDFTPQNEQMFYNSFPATGRLPTKQLIKAASCQ